MSDHGGAPRAWAFYLDDMIGFAEKVLAYTNGLDQGRFVREDLVYDATLRNLELIGEAASHVAAAVRQNIGSSPGQPIFRCRPAAVHGGL